jgi:hypothetical protein
MTVDLVTAWVWWGGAALTYTTTGAALIANLKIHETMKLGILLVLGPLACATAWPLVLLGFAAVGVGHLEE